MAHAINIYTNHNSIGCLIVEKYYLIFPIRGDPQITFAAWLTELLIYLEYAILLFRPG